MITSSNALIDFLRQEIDAHQGKLPFDKFMEIVLYHPEWGYYNAETFDIGKKGDFITAPEISPLFAQCFAKQCAQIFLHLNKREIIELGAGTGRLAGDLLLALEKLGYLPEFYFIYEISHALREKQESYLRETCPHLFSRVKWLTELPQNLEGIILANEVLDALPVHRFRIEENQIQESYVSWEDGFQWTYATPSNKLFNEVEKLRTLYDLSNGYESEINLNMVPFLEKVFKTLKKGIVLFIDYGYGQQEYYHPERNQGTLTCFQNHTHHSNPLINPGLQDITAHVDFTRVAETAVANNYSVTGYTTQSAFLLACGLLDLAAEAEKGLSPEDEVRLHQAIKILTMPMEMGERIKVIALNKELEIPLLGFSLQDRRWDL